MKMELRPWKSDNQKELMEICNKAERPYLSNRLPHPYTLENADWWLNMVAAQDGKEGLFRAVVVDDQYVGNLTVERKSDVHTRDGEIGYILHPDWKSKGIMTEAVTMICPMVFSQLDLLRITGLVYQPNTPSRRVLEKSGFVLEGLMKQAVFKDGNVYDLCIYGKYR